MGVKTMTIQTMGDLVQGRKPLTIDFEETVLEATRRMTEARKAAVLVLQEGRLAGIFTERDLLQRVLGEGRNPAETRISEVMTAPVHTAPADLSYREGLKRMADHHVRYLPLVDEGRLVGMVSRRDLMALDIEVIEGMLERAEPAALFI